VLLVLLLVALVPQGLNAREACIVLKLCMDWNCLEQRTNVESLDCKPMAMNGSEERATAQVFTKGRK
jgi:hypothetical protein